MSQEIQSSIEDALNLEGTAEEIRESIILETLGKFKSVISEVKTEDKIEDKVVSVKVEPRYGTTELADVARDVYHKNINPPDKKAVESKKPVSTPDTIASRANVVALSRSLAGLRSSGNEGKTSPVGPNGAGNLGKISPVGSGGLGNVGTNTASGNYYALTTDMTLEEYEAHVENIFNEVSPSLMKAGQENFDRENRLPDGRVKPLRDRVKKKKDHSDEGDCGCKKCNEDVVHELEQKLVTLGSIDWIQVDKVLREVSESNGVRPKDLSRAFKEEHGMYPDKWIRENLQKETVGLMPLEEAARINRVGQVYEVTFMFRGGTQRLKFFWPQVGKPTREQMQHAVTLFWPKGRLITFYPSLEYDRQNLNQMVMVPPQTDNYAVLHKEDWSLMSEEDSETFYTICEEEGEPIGSPELNEDGTYQVHISDHDTGDERVIFFGEGWKPKDQAKVDKKIGKVADAEAIERGKSEKYGRDDAKIDKLYKRQQAMRFGKKMSQIGEAAYPGYDEQGNPLPKEDKRKIVTQADKKANTPAYQKFKAGDSKYKAADHLK